MTATRWLLVGLGAAALAAAALVIFFVFRTPPERLTAADVAEAAVKDLPGARDRFLYKPLRLSGIVEENLLVDGEHGPFTMISLTSGSTIKIQAAFETAEAKTLAVGAEACLEGVCQLIEKDVILIDKCRLIGREEFAVSK